MTPHNGRNPSHNPGLDLVRSAAILLVLYSHASSWFVGSETGSLRATYLGAVGVELFFALSGFLIGGILLRIRDSGLTPRSLGRFWTRRWVRTLPAYYTVIAGLCWWFGTWDWPAFAFAQNFFPFDRRAPLSPHVWSLALEEWFYVLFPLLLLALDRARHAVPLLCAVLIVLCTAGQALVQRGAIHLASDPNINPLLRLDAPAWGVLAAWKVERRTLTPAASLACLLAGTLATAAQAWAFLLAFDPARQAAWHYALWQPAWSILRVTTTSLGLAFVVAGACGLVRTPVPLLSPAAAQLAALSYALYLTHVPVIYLAQSWQPGLAVAWPGHLAVIGLVLAASLVLRHAIERPFLALREHLTPTRRPAAPAP